MSEKTSYFAQMAEEAAGSVTGSYDAWTGFLKTAGRLYKYPYQDQLMIYAQRPDATACASYELWNNTMQRYIKRGSRGIGLIDNSGEYPRVHYVFDVADTGARRNSREVQQWKLLPEHESVVREALSATYGIPENVEPLEDMLEQIAAQQARQYWEDFGGQLLGIVADSYLESYDEFNIGASFRKAASVSVLYQLFSRCFGNPHAFLSNEDFIDVYDFNTRQTANALGTAVSSISSEILRELERTIRAYERTRQSERSAEHERTELYPERGLSDSRPSDAADRAQDAGQVRQDAPDIPSGAEADAVQRLVPDGEAVSPSLGGAGDGDPAHGADDAGAAGAEPGPGQEGRPDGLGTAYEQPESTGGGSRDSGAGSQLGAPPIIGVEQLTLFPSEESQIEAIDHPEAESEQSSAFAVSDEDIDRALRYGSGFEGGKLRIYALYQQQGDAKERAAFLKKEYGIGGHSFTFSDDTNGFVDYSGNGLLLRSYEHGTEKRLTWAQVEKWLSVLIEREDYLTDAEKVQFAELEQEYGGNVPQPFARSGFPAPPITQAEPEADDFSDIDPMEVREALEADGVVGGQLAEGAEPSSFVREVMDAAEQIAARERAAQESGAAIDAEAALVPEPGDVADPPYTYKVGDMVYLDNTAFQISDIRGREIELQDQTSRYPLFRSEPKIQFERLLRQDERNESITDFLPAALDQMDIDLQEVLTVEGGLFNQQEKGEISVWLRAGESNSEIAQKLAARFSGLAESVELSDVRADCYSSPDGLEVVLVNNEENRVAQLSASWHEIAEITRAMYAMEQDGFHHETDIPASVQEEIPAGDLTREPSVHTETTAFYPAEQNHLPYDVVIQELHFDEPEQEQSESRPEPVYAKTNGELQDFPSEDAALDALAAAEVPVSQNFHIADDHLGEGGPKAKFRANIMAIQLLKKCEEENRPATPEEQEILSRFVGWGGLADAFDPDKAGWGTEYLELKTVLTPEEYAAARASTLNAHYTSPTVIKAIYDAVAQMGFTGGNVLEPSMGVGNFFGLLPESMAGSRLYGVELDSITGRIAQLLYPQADITVAGFETTDQRDFYDLAVGNVPFGNYRVSDKPYDKLGFSIHNYFFAKAIDQVRPGGVVAFVTSRYTMDAKSPEARKYIAQRAELLGAIRLPNNAFLANAGTGVVSDILFLQKRDRPIDIEADWVHLEQTADGFAINSYFVDHPEMVLGELSAESTQYAKEECTVRPIPGVNLAEQLREAITHIHGRYQAAEITLDDAETAKTVKTIPADPEVKNYSFTVVDGEVYFRENSVMSAVELSDAAKGRVKGMVALRQVVNELIEYQLEGYPDEQISAKQLELNEVYDAFTAEYGLLNSRANARVFEEDSSYYLLCSLENIDENGELKSKADMFTRRTIRPERRVTHVDTPIEALAISIGERGKVDLPFMAELLGTPEQFDTIISDLNGVIFCDPMEASAADVTVGWHTADDYLSGNVREKLRAAQLAAKTDERYTVNVTALEKAQPKDLDASEIDVRLGATWIDPRYVQQFMYETFETPYWTRRVVDVKYSPLTAEWRVEGKSALAQNDVAAYVTYGTARANAYKILEDTLNLRDVRIYDTIEGVDGQKRVLNKKETTLAQQKQQAIKDAFRDWVWRNPERRADLVKTYNELFNSTRPREYDGSHIRFVGMNPEIELREHQKNAIAHVLYGGNTMLAHEVGAGKTFEMAASAMESKRLGLCQKSMFVVPNHLTLQWANEFLRLYPSAKILVTTKKDFEAKHRKKFCARIATGDYDAVIIGHSQFEKIPISAERQQRLLQEQISEITEALNELKRSRSERFSIKQMEKTRKSLQAKLKKLTETDRKDDVVTFEQLGVDRLFVDESQAYKNLFLYTKMRNVAGLSTSEAQRSSDMFMKCRYLDEMTGGRGVVFASGTPVSNSMTELYTLMRYLQYGTLQQAGLTHFDCWASTFGETVTGIELAPEGTGYRARTRFAKFFNLPELMAMFKEAADIKTADQLHLPVPEAKFETVVVQPSEIQKEMVAALSERAALVHSGAVDASKDNMLCITSDGRKIGLDQRLMNPLLPDDPNSKLNACVRNVFQIWQEGRAERLTQLLFCDMSTPKGDGTFNVYEDIQAKLIAAGVPKEEIAFIHDADTEAKKKDLFAKVRTGQVRVLLGSTQKMGAGTNVQDLLVAVHHLDVGWRPADMTQRNGRIIRQGNRNKQVRIFNYVTEGTFDAYLYQTLENKQRFISQIMTSKSPVRSCDDVDEQALSYAEIKALCAGNPAIKEKMDLDIDVARLKVLKADHQSQHYRLEDRLLKYFPAAIEKQQGFIRGFEADVATATAHPQIKDGFCGIEISGTTFTEKADAGKAILAACESCHGSESVPLGTYRGFRMELSYVSFSAQFQITLRGQMSHRVMLGDDARGNLIRMDNAIAAIPSRMEAAQEQLENLFNQRTAAQEELQKPFPQEEELRAKSARLAELDAELSMDERGSTAPEVSVADEISDSSERPSVLAELKSYASQIPPAKHRPEQEEVL